MIFVDASALVSIMAREDDALILVERIGAEARRFYSAMSQWETVASLCRSHRFTVRDARSMVESFFEGFGFEIVAIGAREAEIASDAYQNYGRGRHAASLNMGDCFAYACAKSYGARLVYKGADFALTDLA